MSNSDIVPLPLLYENGHLVCDGCELLALTEKFGTPLYAYSLSELQRKAHDWVSAGAMHKDRVFYAMKANSSQALLKEFIRFGFGFDIVSGGELARALAAGADPKNIVYSGVGKSKEEITAALTAGILCFNVESESELLRISAVAKELGKCANISLRVNPDIDAKTHPYISTGLKKNKFGVSFDDAPRLYKLAQTLPNIRITGIDAHIGSQLTQSAPFIHALEKILDIVDSLKDDGIKLDHIDVGGGLGICYTTETPPSVDSLVSALHAVLCARGYKDTTLFFEPGRSLIASCGLLLTRVEYLKKGPEKNFCIVDASMTEMIRPALYQATMPLFNCINRGESSAPFDIVGPVCESSDWLERDSHVAVKEGDVLVMANAGAYGMSMASTYNSRVTPAEVLLKGGKATLIRKKSSIDDILRLEVCDLD